MNQVVLPNYLMYKKKPPPKAWCGFIAIGRVCETGVRNTSPCQITAGAFFVLIYSKPY